MSYEDTSHWRLATEGGIPYRLVTRSGRSEYELAENTEEILIAAGDLLAFLLESFPPPKFYNGFPVYEPRRMPGMPGLATSNVSWEGHVDGKPVDPFGVDGGAPSDTYQPVLKLTIEYSTNPAIDLNDPESFLEVTADTACQVLNVTAKGTSWETSASESPGGGGADDIPVEEPNDDPAQTVPIIVPMTEWSLTWKRVPRRWYAEVLRPRLKQAAGRVNSEYVDFLDAAPETLLMVGHSISDHRYSYVDLENPSIDWTQFDMQQLDVLTVTMKFLAKDVYVETDPEEERYKGHNHFWRDADQTWVKLKLPNDEYAYKTYDMNQLFTVDDIV